MDEYLVGIEIRFSAGGQSIDVSSRLKLRPRYSTSNPLGSHLPPGRCLSKASPNTSTFKFAGHMIFCT